MEQALFREHERVDDLLTHHLKIIQSDEVFSFSLDAVLLARFCTVPPKGRIIDLGTGNGVIPLLLSTRTKAAITGVEIQERLWDMAARSVQLNRLERQLTMIQGDLREIHRMLGSGVFDAVTINPPYLPYAAGDKNVNAHIAAARHEISCTLAEAVSACAGLVRSGGKVAMVHKPSRLAEIIMLFRQNRLEPKRIRFVHPRIGQEANMVLIEAARDGKPEVRLLPPLIVHEGESYCQELQDIFMGRQNRLTAGEGG